MIPIHVDAAPPAAREQAVDDTRQTGITTRSGVPWIVESNPRIPRRKNEAEADLRVFKTRTSSDPQQ